MFYKKSETVYSYNNGKDGFISTHFYVSEPVYKIGGVGAVGVVTLLHRDNVNWYTDKDGVKQFERPTSSLHIMRMDNLGRTIEHDASHAPRLDKNVVHAMEHKVRDMARKWAHVVLANEVADAGLFDDIDNEEKL